MSIVFLRKKSVKYNLIRSLSEGGQSVQNICVGALIVLAVASVDVLSYLLCAYSYCTLSRMLLCIATVYNVPCLWAVMVCMSFLATVTHQAGGHELLLGAVVIALVRYASLRMVNTDFSRWVLIGVGYSVMELLSYLTIMSVTATELGSHIAVAGILFLVYTMLMAFMS